MNTAIGTLRFEHELGRVDLRVVAELISLSNNEEVPGRAPGRQVVRTEQDFGYGYPAHQAQYMYEEGNYSCDCNRSVFMGIEPGMSCGETIEMVSFKVEERD